MKKNIRKTIISLLSFLIVLGMNVTPALAEDLPAGADTETAISDVLIADDVLADETSSDPDENDELFMQYVNNRLYEEAETAVPGLLKARRVMPQGTNGVIYNVLKAKVKLVADGVSDWTIFEVSLDELGFAGRTWTAADLGVSAIIENNAISQAAKSALIEELGIDLRSVLTALLFDCPYDLYWYDKVTGCRTSGPGIRAENNGREWTIGLSSGLTIMMAVADGYSTGTQYTVDTSRAERVGHAVDKAAALVDAVKDGTDHDKLLSYKNAICSLVSYDYNAARNESLPYGDPWQVISVFDEDESTNVVCEGYSKAFQYLCDLSDFESDLDCISVSGTMSGGTGSGAHMWNILCMGDGKNYLADITNCDEGTVGSPDKLFIAGYTSGDVSSGYTFSCTGGSIKYYYDSETTSAFDDELIIAPKGSCSHDLIRSEEIPATCTVDGVREYWTCTVCEGLFGDANATETLEQADIIIPAGHKEEVMPAVAATCTEEGLTEGLKCSVCGEILTSQEVVPAKGHDWNDWTVIREATAKEEGLKTRTCKRDPSHTETRAIPKKEVVIENVERVYGTTRFETSIKVADDFKEKLGKDSFDYVIIAYGRNYADALAGSYLSCVLDAPILLVDAGQDHINAVQAYIKDNLNTGGTIYMLGGTAVVPDSAVAGLGGYTIKRLWGKDRYETNVAILTEAAKFSTGANDILVCSGTGFADSLSAAAAGKPIMLVRNTLQDCQKNYLNGLSGSKAFTIIGGTGAVNNNIEKELSAYGTVDRIGGSTRYETSVNVAKKLFANPKAAVLAYGQTFPDGLCGGALAHAIGGPLILVANGRTQYAEAYLKENGVEVGAVLGGPALISDASAKEIYNMSGNERIIVI